MELFGRYEFDSSRSPDPVLNVWTDIVSPLLADAQRDPHGFLAALADRVVPAGGWAVYGGERLVKELLSGDFDDPSYHRMMDGALDFLRSQGIPPMRLNGHEWGRWTSTRGGTQDWLPRRPPPTPNAEVLTPLQPGEKRRVAQREGRPDSNVIFVQQDAPMTVTAKIEGAKSDDDPTRAQWDWKSCRTLYDLYLEIGTSLQVPPHWCDPELAAFVPLEKPRIPWLS
jgi:hypothetical protein